MALANLAASAIQRSTRTHPIRENARREKSMQLFLKIVYWTVAAGDILLILLFASGITVYDFDDFLRACAYIGLPVLYLIGSSMLFIRGNSNLKRCLAIFLVLLMPVAAIGYTLSHLPIL
jgi:hypothetical protein